ncbi:MAG: M23 family metallopeptidase [Chitinophagaceae bacterium]|nr:M23 family metallopeptidase [Chitinophagaceae bacterium]
MRLFLSVVLICFSISLFAQKNYPQQYFRNPMNIPMDLSANFGELRSNHWHMGLDIRTQQRENLDVYAAAEGYVSRIRVEPGGFGQAIYITHPNGYTTLYAHLNAFYLALQQYVKEQQYNLESWAVDLQISPTLFPVKKGAYIAKSGNTGGSQGPHVHFEIRDTETERCINPLLFDFPIKDNVPPTIVRLAMYDRTQSVYTQSPVLYSLRKTSGSYELAGTRIIQSPVERISFALQANDKITGSSNPNGIFSATIFCDNTPMTSFVIDDVGYDETRYMNAHIDYRLRKKGGAYLQHLSRMPGDLSNIYKDYNNDGVINLSDTSMHLIRIEVTDAHNNKSTLQFNVQYKGNDKPAGNTNADVMLYPGDMNVFEQEEFEVVINETAIYDTVPVNYSRTNAVAGSISASHKIGEETIPLHNNITIRIKPTEDVAEEIRDKIVVYKDKGGRGAVAKGNWQNGWISASFREFGTFRAVIDTTPPEINSLGSGDTLNLKTLTRIVFRPKDVSGIKNFRAELDGKWLRFTNDKYTSHIYVFDEKWNYGVRELKVTAEDIVGNKTTKSWWIRR